MRYINEIIIHCTATHPDFMEGHSSTAKVKEIKRWHVQGNGWSDIGYHFLIDRDGTIKKGRPLERAGAHVRGRNANSIGISLFGGHGSASTDFFEDHFTPEQDEALRFLIEDLEQDFDIDLVTGHNEYSAKACPGFTVGEWL